MIFQDPMTSLNPGAHDREPAPRGAHAHMDLAGKGRRPTRDRPPRPGRHPEREGPAARLPAPVLGRMRQRAMIAMALACEPKLIIADEPTTALDVTIQAQILDLLRALVADRETALILITHDLGVVAGMCERVNVMYAGTLVETGAPSRSSLSLATRTRSGCCRACHGLDVGSAQRCSRFREQPRNMLSPPAACPFAPRCRFRVESAPRAAAARATRPRPARRVLQPGPCRRMEADAESAGTRVTSGREDAHTGRARRPPRLVPDQERAGARPARRRRQGGRRRDVDDRARRDARPGRRVGMREVDRSAERSSGSMSRPPDESSSTAGHHDALGPRACGRCAGACRWSSRIRTRRSTHGTRSAASSASL